jgi:hypothetical protein
MNRFIQTVLNKAAHRLAIAIITLTTMLTLASTSMTGTPLPWPLGQQYRYLDLGRLAGTTLKFFKSDQPESPECTQTVTFATVGADGRLDPKSTLYRITFNRFNDEGDPTSSIWSTTQTGAYLEYKYMNSSTISEAAIVVYDKITCKGYRHNLWDPDSVKLPNLQANTKILLQLMNNMK